MIVKGRFFICVYMRPRYSPMIPSSIALMLIEPRMRAAKVAKPERRASRDGNYQAFPPHARVLRGNFFALAAATNHTINFHRTRLLLIVEIHTMHGPPGRDEQQGKQKQQLGI